MFRLEHDTYLFALAFVPLMAVLFFRVLRWKELTITRIGDPALVKQLIADYSPQRFLVKFLMILSAFVLSVIGLANLQRTDQAAQVNRKGVDVMIALDVSKSMMAQDISPNRLQRAKLMIGKLVGSLRDDRVGLVLFAGRAYLQVPLTTDHDAVKMYMSSASPASVPTQGTVIGEALQLCNNAFDDRQRKFKAVVLVTDGEDHDGSAAEAAKQMAEEGVLLHTIGVGTETGANLMDPDTREWKRNEDGTAVVSRLNERELVELARTGNGSYQLLADTDEAVNRVLAEIGSMEKKAITDKSLLSYRSYFPWFLGLAALLLAAEMFFSERKKGMA